jgi:hypothetical protein
MRFIIVLKNAVDLEIDIDSFITSRSTLMIKLNFGVMHAQFPLAFITQRQLYIISIDT